MSSSDQRFPDTSQPRTRGEERHSGEIVQGKRNGKGRASLQTNPAFSSSKPTSSSSSSLSSAGLIGNLPLSNALLPSQTSQMATPMTMLQPGRDPLRMTEHSPAISRPADPRFNQFAWQWQQQQPLDSTHQATFLPPFNANTLAPATTDRANLGSSGSSSSGSDAAHFMSNSSGPAFNQLPLSAGGANMSWPSELYSLGESSQRSAFSSSERHEQPQMLASDMRRASDPTIPQMYYYLPTRTGTVMNQASANSQFQLPTALQFSHSQHSIGSEDVSISSSSSSPATFAALGGLRQVRLERPITSAAVAATAAPSSSSSSQSSSLSQLGQTSLQQTDLLFPAGPTDSSTSSPQDLIGPSRTATEAGSSSSSFQSFSDGAREGVPACDFCRKRKVKCDRQQPSCSFCTKHGVQCTTDDRLKKRGPPTKAQRSEMKQAGFVYDRSKRRWRVQRQDEAIEAPSAGVEANLQRPTIRNRAATDSTGASLHSHHGW